MTLSSHCQNFILGHLMVGQKAEPGEQGLIPQGKGPRSR